MLQRDGDVPVKYAKESEVVGKKDTTPLSIGPFVAAAATCPPVNFLSFISFIQLKILFV
jgi:hypothetical protein